MKQLRHALPIALCVSLPAHAEVPPEAEPPFIEDAVSARTQVVLGVTGAIGQELRSSLSGVLEAELRASGFTLVESELHEELSVFAERAVANPRALLGVLLDTRAPSGWRVVVIDTGRRRVVTRELPAGIERDAASIEAVVSIVVSAARALGEGLEVASKPLASVLGPAPAAPATEPPARPAPAPPERPRPTFLRGAVGATLAAFPSARATPGLSVALAVSVRSALELRASASRYWPAAVESAFGEFELDRTLLSLSAGPALESGAFVFTPELGVASEWIRRSETAPDVGVAAEPDRTLHRVGGVFALRGRYLITLPVSIELAAGGAFFGREVRFHAGSPDTSRLATVPPLVLFAELGLDIATR